MIAGEREAWLLVAGINALGWAAWASGSLGYWIVYVEQPTDRTTCAYIINIDDDDAFRVRCGWGEKQATTVDDVLGIIENDHEHALEAPR